MPGTTPNAALPFMEDHDPLADVAAHIQGLAEAVDEWTEWVTYSPTLVASTNPTLGTGGSLQGRYTRMGDVAQVEITLTFGSGMSAGSGVYQFSLPVPPAVAVRHPLGLCTMFDTSAGAVRTYSAMWNTASVVMHDVSGSYVAATNPWTWAAGDTLALSLRYRVA